MRTLLNIERRLDTLCAYTHSFSAGGSQWTIKSSADKVTLYRDGVEVQDVTPAFQQLYGGERFGKVGMGWGTIHDGLQEGFVDDTNKSTMEDTIRKEPYMSTDDTEKRIRTNISNILEAPIVNGTCLRFQCVLFYNSDHRYNRVTISYTTVQIFRISLTWPPASAPPTGGV